MKKNRIAFFGDSLTEGFPGVSYLNMLKDRLPDVSILNYGRRGDTVISLYRRLKDLNSGGDTFDICFLWIGTNDVFVKAGKMYPFLKWLLKQPWVQDITEFRHYFHLILETLIPASKRLITVSPLFIGEDLSNAWNRELETLSEVIREESGQYEKVSFVNLRDFFPVKPSNETRPYVARHISRIILDTLWLKRKEQVDKKSLDRGLYYTLDGVHLNGRGAEIVADIFFKEIIRLSQSTFRK